MSCERALDVGCGRGAFARRLAAIARRVDAIDRNAVTIEHARRDSTSHPNITFIESDFMSWRAPATYDVVAMIATLHHLPFEPALDKAATLLRPGGTLIVLGLNRDPFLVGAMHAAVAYPVSWGHRITRTSALGLKAEEQKRPQPVMVIDSISEKPTDN
jgi:2-polyprenyl-3-methyl-5-hydroxy-6-metoxy-1,4-benzoquinol methylase